MRNQIKIKCTISIIWVFATSLISAQSHLDVEGNVKIRGNIDLSHMSDTSSIFVGRNARINYFNSAARSNTIAGVHSSVNFNTGDNAGRYNSFFGYDAGTFNKGDNNAFFGMMAGYQNQGISNCFMDIHPASIINLPGAMLFLVIEADIITWVVPRTLSLVTRPDRVTMPAGSMIFLVPMPG